MIHLEESNEDSEYEIEKIVGKRISKKGIIEYKIKWLGYDESQSSWEPLSNLNHAKEAIKDYEKKVETLNKNKNKNIISLTKIKEENKKIKKEKKIRIKKEEFKYKKQKTKFKNNKKNNNSIKTSASSLTSVKDILEDDKENLNNFEIIEINSICKINDKYHASVLIRKNNGEKKNTILATSEIADIAPKKLIEFYEDNIRFYD